MFKVGDIVTPKENCIGNGYYFQVEQIELSRFDDNTYKLKRIKQKLDPLKGSIPSQLNTIKSVEFALWKEEDLYAVKTLDSTATLKISPYDVFTSIKSYNLEGIKESINKINKEEKEMDILEIYKEKKIKTLEKEFSEAKKVAIEEDEIQKIIIEMTNQVNTILENEGSDTRYESHPNLYTSKTEAKLNKLNDKYHEQIEELRSTLDEIRALFELTDDYNERIKILKNYDILDKKGKLNV